MRQGVCANKLEMVSTSCIKQLLRVIATKHAKVQVKMIQELEWAPTIG